MKTPMRITLQQHAKDDELYIVDKLVNCVEPLAGTVLTYREVDQLLRRHHLTVTIKRARKRVLIPREAA